VDLQCDFDSGVHESSEMRNNLLSDAAGVAAAGESSAWSGPSARKKKPAMAGAGKAGDMDDEIPF
jgi:hypothetical protein